MPKSISRAFITGLITLLPVVLTLYLLYWFTVTTETLLGGAIRLIVPATYYWPGMGVLAGLAVVVGVGLLMRAYMVRRLFARGEQLLYYVPFIKSVYRAIRDFFDFFSPEKNKNLKQVVAVSLGNGMQVLGLVTRAGPDQMPPDFRQADSVLVYVPMSYMVGGFTVLVPKSALRSVDMSMDEAMRFALSAGISAKADPQG